MKRSILLALCLIGPWSAFAQTSSSSTTTTNSTYSTQNNTNATGTVGSSTSDTTINGSSDSNNSSGVNNSTTGTGTYSTTTPSTSTDNSTYSTTTTTTTSGYGREKRNADRPYKAFTGGFYVGGNTTRYLGEDGDGNALSGRLGYQLGVFVRGGGRVFGQIGAEYFASSSNFYRPGNGTNLQNLNGRIEAKWLQIPAYIGVKLVESDRGISAIRLQVGAEYANQLSSSNTVDLSESEFRSGHFLGLANVGFDIGPLVIDVVYHHGFTEAVRGFNNSLRRSLGLNVGLKF